MLGQIVKKNLDAIKHFQLAHFKCIGHSGLPLQYKQFCDDFKKIIYSTDIWKSAMEVSSVCASFAAWLKRMQRKIQTYTEIRLFQLDW